MGEREHYNGMWNLASNYLANSADFGPAKLAQLGCFTAQGRSLRLGFSDRPQKRGVLRRRRLPSFVLVRFASVLTPFPKVLYV